MTFVGSDTDQLRTFATTIDQASEHIDSLISELHGTANELDWAGNDATQFRNIVERLATSAVGHVVQALRTEATTLRANADRQDQVSGSLDGSPGHSTAVAQSVDGKGTVGADEPHSTRLDSPEARQEALTSIANFLRNAGARKYLPGGFAKADEWLKELQGGNATPEQVQAFQSYMAVLKLANLQRGTVADAAHLAVAELASHGKAQADAIQGAFTFHATGGLKIDTQRISDALSGAAKDSLKTAGYDAATEPAVSVGEAAIVAHYNSNADRYLMDLADPARHGTTVGFTEPSKLAFSKWHTFESRIDQVRISAERADALSPLTGTGDAIDSALRTALHAVPVAGTTLDALSIVGNLAQAGIHGQVASQALDLALNGSLHSIAGFADALHISN